MRVHRKSLLMYIIQFHFSTIPSAKCALVTLTRANNVLRYSTLRETKLGPARGNPYHTRKTPHTHSQNIAVVIGTGNAANGVSGTASIAFSVIFR